MAAPRDNAATQHNGKLLRLRAALGASDGAAVHEAWLALGEGRSRLIEADRVMLLRLAKRELEDAGGDTEAIAAARRDYALAAAQRRSALTVDWARLCLRAGDVDTPARLAATFIGAAPPAHAGVDVQVLSLVSLAVLGWCSQSRDLQPLLALVRGQPHLRSATISLPRIRRTCDAVFKEQPCLLPNAEQAREAAMEAAPLLDALWGIDSLPARQAEDEEDDGEPARSLASSDPDTQNSLATRFASLAGMRQADAVLALDAAAQRAIEFGYLRSGADAEWTDQTTASLLEALLGLDKRAEAAAAWKAHLVRSGKARPSSTVWSGLLHGYARVVDSTALWDTWKSMRPEERTPKMLTTTISGLFHGREVEEARERAMALFQEARAQGPLSVEVWNAVLYGQVTSDRIAVVESLLAEMVAGRDGAPRPSVSTFNTVLRYFARRGDIAELQARLRAMSELGIEPDVVTYTTVLDGLMRAGRSSPTATVLQLMRESGEAPNVYTHTALLKGLLNPGGTLEASGARMHAVPHFREALELLLKMEAEGPLPSEVTYNAVAHAVVRHGTDVHEALSTLPEPFSSPVPLSAPGEEPGVLDCLAREAPNVGIALQIWDRMRARKLPLPRPAVHTFLMAFLSASHLPEPAVRALERRTTQLLERCTSEGPSPRPRTWLLVLQLLMERNSPATLKRVLALHGKWAADSPEAADGMLGRLVHQARTQLAQDRGE
jgi:pentatricopeptide repeat protein